MPKVLITDYVHPTMISRFEDHGFDVTYDRSIVNESLADIISEYDGVVINSKIFMDRAMIDKAKKLKFIGRLGSGLEIINVAYAKEKNIHVINTPKGNNNAVAEHAVGMLLMLANNLRQADADVRALNWNREGNRGWELKGKTIGIIGFGHTGSQFAKKLSSWELDVISYDKYRQDYPPEFNFVEQVSLEDILIRSDIITLHLPLTEETINFVNSNFLKHCKDGVVIINTSRGKVVKTTDLIDGLKSGKVKGACLDVLENEKPHTYSHERSNTYKILFGMENVVLSPHIAGWTHESLKKIADIMLHKIELANIAF